MENDPKATPLFPQTRGYRLWPAAVAEPADTETGKRGFHYTERHLQCVWFDATLRPARLTTTRGEEIVVEHPGQWNLEDGPDFLNAVLRVGPERRRLAGDVEIHVQPSDWQRHGHNKNPAYAGVVAHVTFFPGAVAPADLPHNTVQIPLQDGLAANPFFSFESLDLTAYPYAAREPATPCSQILKAWGPERVAGLLETAGEERLRRKTERLAAAITLKGPDQTLYEEMMTALGYKNNRAPFRYLAEQFPLEALRQASGRDTLKAYALLMGVAGLLPAQTPARWDAETRVFVRQLWDFWWKHQAAWNTIALPRTAWKLSGLRPQNHPQRRLMLAALLFVPLDAGSANKPGLTQRLMALNTDSPADAMASMLVLCRSEADTYWQRRLAFSGKAQAAPVALMGEQRAAAIVSNVIVPFLAASGNQSVMRPSFLSRLPPEEDNQILRQTAHNLLGPDHNPALYRTGLRQQGLIQIFCDFCLTDRSLCAQCALLKSLKREILHGR